MKDKPFERTSKCRGGSLIQWKVEGLQIIVSVLESGGGRLKDRTEGEGQALREDGKCGSRFKKVTTNKEKNVIWLQS